MRYRPRVRSWLCVVLVACGSSPATPVQPIVAPREVEVPMSDPAEYQIDRFTREAGKAIF